MRNAEFLELLRESLPLLDEQFVDLPAHAGAREEAGGGAVMRQVAERLADNYPYFHPLYAGQMLKPPHPVARAAYAMAMALNPNNHALDGGRASSRMEMEAVAALARMFGFATTETEKCLGHLTSSGTLANLEALWVAGQLRAGAAILASDQAHYTHARISGVLKLNFEAVASDDRGRMDMRALEARLAQAEVGERRPVGTVVATLGTTATGSVDPLKEMVELRERYGFRIHVDAAYGGYFKLSSMLQTNTQASFDAVAAADSIVIDPHKHGLQPYGCGCVLFRDAGVEGLYRHDSPYTYFTSAELHLGEISLECSRAGASAVALWATQQVLPMVTKGAFAGQLDLCREAAMDLYARLAADPDFVPAFVPELDITVWAVRAERMAESSRYAQAIFEECGRRGLHLAVATLPARFFPEGTWPDTGAAAMVQCLRSVLMKPEHAHWMSEVFQRLAGAKEAVFAREA